MLRRPQPVATEYYVISCVYNWKTIHKTAIKPIKTAIKPASAVEQRLANVAAPAERREVK